MKVADPPADAGEWATTSGDLWADRWRDTDTALESLSVHLLSALIACAPERSFRAFDIGCGPGSTAIAAAEALPDTAIIACDISPSLAAIARQRTADRPTIRIVVGDAEEVAVCEGQFDLMFSRHGVMFFPDPVQAFRNLRSAVNPGASLAFSCFRSWDSNPWASEVANAAADRKLAPPGREPGGFAFADPDYVHRILGSSGWSEATLLAVDFSYVAGQGNDAVEQAVSFLLNLGPASRVVQALPDEERPGARERMRPILEQQFDGSKVVFPAAAWIWQAKAG